MRLINTVILSLGFILIIFTAPGYSADVAKIGVVDFQRILKESKAGKYVAKELRKKQEERTRDLNKRREEIVELQKYVESIELTGDKDDREKKRLELNLKLESFADTDKMYNAALKEINTKHTLRIRNESEKVIEKIGKKGGYLLIVKKSDILYSPSSTDITTMVINQYDKQYGGER